MTNIPMVFCFDERILVGAGVTIKSLLDAAKPSTIYEINIFNPGFDAQIKEDLLKLVDSTRHSMRFFEIPPERFEGVPKGKGSWTEIVYYRLLSSEILTDREKIIYSDVDVFFKQDMQDAFATDLHGLEWAGVPLETNTPEKIMHYYFPENTKPRIVASGFMIMNLKLMRERRVVERYFETVKAVGDRLVFFDLDLVNIATPEIGEVGLKYCVLEDIYETEDVTEAADYRFLRTIYAEHEVQAARDAPAIIHFAGRRGKPWQRQRVPAYYLDVWRNLPAGLRKKTRKDFRRTWLSARGYRAYPYRSDLKRML